MNKLSVTVLLMIASIIIASVSESAEMEKSKSGAYIFPTVPYELRDALNDFNCQKNWILFYSEAKDQKNMAMVICLKPKEIEMICANVPKRISVTSSGSVLSIGNMDQCLAIGDAQNRDGELWIVYNKVGSKYRHEVIIKTKFDKNHDPTYIGKRAKVLEKIELEKKENGESEE